MSDENGDGMVSAEEARGRLPGAMAALEDMDEELRDIPVGASVDITALADAAGYVEALRTVIALHKRLEGVGVVECLAARDAATRERARADKVERERDEARKALGLVRYEIGRTAREINDMAVWTDDAHAATWGAAYNRARLSDAEAERDRLARILAVERGDESQAPEGWRAGAAGWCVYGPGGQADRLVERAETNGPWEWYVYEPNGDGEGLTSGKAGSALEAMEAADAAREGSDV